MYMYLEHTCTCNMLYHTWTHRHTCLSTDYMYGYVYVYVKITHLLVSTVAKNSGNCNLICPVDCYGYTCNYNLIIVISISLSCLIDVQNVEQAF